MNKQQQKDKALKLAVSTLEYSDGEITKLNIKEKQKTLKSLMTLHFPYVSATPKELVQALSERVFF